MPRPPIHRTWRARIVELFANGLESAAAIARQLDTQEEMARLGRTDPPHRSTVARVIASLSPEELESARFVRWPDSFDSKSLPWQAAPGLLAELAWRADNGMYRPTILWAQWWWRLRQSAPEAPASAIRYAATAIAATAAVVGPLPREATEQVEDWLAHRGWARGDSLRVLSSAALVPPEAMVDFFIELRGMSPADARDYATALSNPNGDHDDED